MKTLKITLLLALFLSVSSQSDKIPADNETILTYKAKQTEYILIAHQKPSVKLPGQN